MNSLMRVRGIQFYREMTKRCCKGGAVPMCEDRIAGWLHTTKHGGWMSDLGEIEPPWIPFICMIVLMVGSEILLVEVEAGMWCY